jgi:hypothetical protein
MRIQFASLCAFICVSTLSLAAEVHPSPSHPQVVVSVFNDAGVEERTLLAAENTASQIYHQAGLELAWESCGKEEGRPCTDPAGPAHVALRIEHQPRSLAADVYGVAYLGDNGVGSYCDLFYDRIAALYRQGKVSEGRILGIIAAHELGHLLLGSHAHSAMGIMRPQWQPQDFGDSIQSLRCFSRQQVQTMAQKLAHLGLAS